ncbi:MAG: pentapeptide repeat-containing protein [Timaviella obliquedivisa GSE-PSE-MK23-08B]|jgi:uncharacterized protein YjbI with pentapeptide repeats|nr:pentapeptide repeat-containing protein [Timaviella obliquedivisa GSE-PSE-MK23-08B]
MCEKIQRFVQLVSEANHLNELVIAAGLDPSEDLVNADLRRISFMGGDLSGYNLSGADLSGADLRGASLNRANLSQANLTDARLDRASLRGTILIGARLNRAKLTNASIRIAKLNDAELESAYLEGADLRGANLTGAKLCHAHLGRVDLRGAQLSGANLADTNLRCADMRGAYARGANFTQAKLDGADLGNANLTEVNLSHASLQRVHGDGCDLNGAQMQGADLRNANFSATDFSRTQLHSTQFENALIVGSVFMECQGLSESLQTALELRGAIFSENSSSEVSFTQSDIENRIADLEHSVNRLGEWAENLRRKVSEERVSLLRRNPLDRSAIAQTEVLRDLANEVQTSCLESRHAIFAYRVSSLSETWTAKEFIAEYNDINEQLVKVSFFIQIVQIILVDVPGFIDRSA